MCDVSLVLLKPDCIEHGLVSVVENELARYALEITGVTEVRLTLELIKEWRKWTSFFGEFEHHCEYICRCPVKVYLVTGPQALEKTVELKKILRELYGEGVFANVVHCPTSVDEAINDISFFFPGKEFLVQ